MFISLIGAVLVIGVFVTLVFLSEKILWSGWREFWSDFRSDWRYIFPGYRKQQTLYKEICDQYDGLFRLVYGDAWGNTGLEDQVKDLKQVLEWTRKLLADAKDEVLSQINQAHNLREALESQKKDSYRQAVMINELTHRIQVYLKSPAGAQVVSVRLTDVEDSLKAWVKKNPEGYKNPAMKIRKKRQVLDQRYKK